MKQRALRCFPQMEDVRRFVTAPIWHCTGMRESLLTASPIILMDIMPMIFWLIRSFICFGRFVISVSWGRRTEIYLVSIKWPACFSHDLILYQRNSPDGSHKMVDCHDLFLPPVLSPLLLFTPFPYFIYFSIPPSSKVLECCLVWFIPSFPSDSPLFHLLQELLFSLEKRI